MLEFLERLDVVVDRLWTPIVSLICRITRMSNFTIARGALVLGSLVLATDQAIKVLDQSINVLQLFFLPVWTVVGIPTLIRVIRKLERGEETAK